MTKEYSDFLAHYGIKGQKHGIRRFQNEDGSLTDEGRSRYGVGDKKDWKRLDRDARKDAEEYVRAKAFYGEGAGVRRRKINGIVNERSRDADYKAAFDKYVSQQDTERAKVAADRKRGFEDTKNAIIHNPFTQLAATAVAGLAVSQFIRKGGPQKVAKWGQRTIRSIGSKVGGATSRAKTRFEGWKLGRRIRVMR
jgi:hypothetical protein